jgi:hypothetical protein
MKRGMLAVLLLVLSAGAVWGADWYRYRGTLSLMSWDLGNVTGEPGRYQNASRGSMEVDVLLCYDSTPYQRGSILFEPVSSDYDMIWNSAQGEFGQVKTKLQFRASSASGVETVVGRGSFNAKETTLNLQGSAFFRSLPNRSQFGQYLFRGKFVDIISR